MDFHGGRFEGRLVLGTVDGGFDVDMRGEELDFGQIVSGAGGRLSLSAAGLGVFGKDRLPGLFTIKDMALSPLRKTEARGEFGVDISGGRVILGIKGGLVPGENPFEGSFEFPLAGAPFSGTVKGSLGDLRDVSYGKVSKTGSGILLS